jgi:hypothetical protein
MANKSHRGRQEPQSCSGSPPISRYTAYVCVQRSSPSEAAVDASLGYFDKNKTRHNANMHVHVGREVVHGCSRARELATLTARTGARATIMP